MIVGTENERATIECMVLESQWLLSMGAWWGMGVSVSSVKRVPIFHLLFPFFSS
ncbi:hypothetical protein SLEP1_g27910 [Rubroshorea leprosula]|uniref:Uncharacterized protein n=1 Tax=Rubroshorea leprosula TaxID=152421 RepID=A0AAV5K4I8_9ROSI|nr:hypothetical protein SLEP1_g27910 [Rubroshorea leprosula]